MKRIMMKPTPVGVASFPKLTRPNYKFKPKEGEFSVQLILTPEEAKLYRAEFDANFKELYREECAKQGKKKISISRHHPPFNPEVDQQDNETGNIAVKFKMKHKIYNREGEFVFEQRPTVFDKYGKPSEADVGYGAKIQISAELKSWFVPSDGFGITLIPKAVIVREEGSGGFNPSDASAYGFTIDEEQQVNGGESLPESVFGEVEEEAAHASDF
jgi:hypothetical protein